MSKLQNQENNNKNKNNASSSSFELLFSYFMLLAFAIIFLNTFMNPGSFVNTGAFAGLGFFAWYLAGKIKAFDRRGHVAKLCIVLLPILCASLIAISRVDDYWHHWQDVFAGGFLGLVVASFCYLQFFPPPYHTDGWGPHAYFFMLAESQSRNGSTSIAADNLNVIPATIEPMYIQSGGQNHLALRDSAPTPDEMEAGVDRRMQ